MSELVLDIKPVVEDIQCMIEQSQQKAIQAVNTEATLLYWQVGKRINDEVLQNNRAEYGKRVVAMLAARLTEKYGKGWGHFQLRQCMQLSTIFPNEKILYALRTKLSWTKIRSVIYMDDPLKRDFYIQMTIQEGWSSRVLQERIRSMLYERTAISKKPEQTIRNDLEILKNQKIVSQDLVFRDPYLLNFLGLADTYSEKDLESAIVAEMQNFIIEMGSDFAFMARQKRIEIDHRDYYIDLLFFHRRLKRLIAIELKIGEFDAAYKGQMELYLRYLEKYEMLEGENPPIGLILCTGKSKEHVELMDLHKSNIRLADYLTILPPQEVLKDKLHQARLLAQENQSAQIEIIEDYNIQKDDE